MPNQHQERPPGALAHGPATADDIERVREQVTTVEERHSGLAARYWQHVTQRAIEQRTRAQKR
jgi:hypothetical protein